MLNLKKLLTVSVAGLMLSSAGLSSASYVAHADEISDNVIQVNTGISEHVEFSNSIPGIQTREAATLVFLGGMVVAWVIDGVITYATGRAPSEWVAIGLGKVHSYILSQASRGVKNIHIAYGAFTCPGVVIDHSGICGW